MEYMCAYKTCPHYAEPCIFSESDMEAAISKSTICPIGEDERYFDFQRENTFFCMVVGTRTYNNYQTFCTILDKALSSKTHQKIIIISGGAKGADSLAEKYAKEKGYHMIVFEAEWERLGNKAGPIRNEQMHKFVSTFPNRGVIAFWDGKSRGTASNFNLAKQYQNQIRIYNYTENRFMSMST